VLDSFDPMAGAIFLLLDQTTANSFAIAILSLHRFPLILLIPSLMFLLQFEFRRDMFASRRFIFFLDFFNALICPRSIAFGSEVNVKLTAERLALVRGTVTHLLCIKLLLLYLDAN
jgi:hypothetical protein